MRILILNYEFPPLGGGAGNATRYLLKEFAKDPNLEINLVTSSVGRFKTEQFAPNITIHYLDIGKQENLHYQEDKDLLKYSWKTYWYCRKLKRQTSFDLIHAFFGIPCGYIAMKLGLPYIVSLRGSDVPFYNKRFYWLDKLVFQRLSRKIWKKAKAIVANSQGLRKLALKTNPGQKIEVIYNGVDTDGFKPNKNLKVKTRESLISVGRLIERKGYQYLFPALKWMADVELTLLGDGLLREELEKMAMEYNVRVNFAGNVEHDKIINYLQKADIFILPSLNEGMSNAILEAMACGLPIIATDTGGSVELVKGNGFVVPKADSKALREAIMKYIKNPDIIREHGARSRKLAEEMSWGKMARTYKKIYELA
ncbi:MAG: glycosyltransferase family 4 protein [Phenylobacterium sp.]